MKSSILSLSFQSYSSIDSLLYQSRMTKLQAVQALTEIQDFINFMTKRSKYYFFLSDFTFIVFNYPHFLNFEFLRVLLED